MKPDAIEMKQGEIKQKDILLKYQYLNYGWKIWATHGDRKLNIHSMNLGMECI